MQASTMELNEKVWAVKNISNATRGVLVSLFVFFQLFSNFLRMVDLRGKGRTRKEEVDKRGGQEKGRSVSNNKIRNKVI